MAKSDSRLDAAALSLYKSISYAYKLRCATAAGHPPPGKRAIMDIYADCFAKIWAGSGSSSERDEARSLAGTALGKSRADAVANKPEIGLDPFFDILQLRGTTDRPLIFDVGANRGQSISRFRDRFPHSIIHAFEPVPSAFERLSQASSGLSDVFLLNMALGSQPGQVELIENTFSNMSSLLEFGPDCWGKESGRHSVPIDTLDNYCARSSVPRIDVVKIDTQGYELEVLKGSTEMMREGRIDFVLLETIFSKMYRGLPGLDQIYRFLLDHGFSLVSFYKMHYQNNRAAWTDALFIRNSYPSNPESA
jgi:FkbM family methyltransferase